MRMTIPTRGSLAILRTDHLMIASFALAALGAIIYFQVFVSAFGIPALRPIAGSAWQMAELDAHGRILRLGPSPLFMSLAFSLIAVGVAGLAIAAFGGRREEVQAGRRSDAELAPLLDNCGKTFEAEILSVLKLITEQLGTNKRYATALIDADAKLNGPLTIEQFKRVVGLLLIENTKAKNEITQLQSGFERSKGQIEALRFNLQQAVTTSYTDGLTALKNRRWLDENLKAVVEAVGANGDALSFVLADIDHFKSINDRYGHQTGDEVLQRFASLLSDRVREPAAAVRYGGEEFAVVLPGKALEEARRVAEGTRADLETKQWTHHTTKQPLGKVTASFGVSQYRKGERLGDLIERADKNLYAAKSSGRNRTIVDDE